MIAMPIDSQTLKSIGDEIITPQMSEIKAMIAQTFMQRNQLKNEMQSWYEIHPKEHFPNMKSLILIDSKLSELDSCYKKLWDYNNTRAFTS